MKTITEDQMQILLKALEEGKITQDRFFLIINLLIESLI
jgi:hypothetical protein